MPSSRGYTSFSQAASLSLLGKGSASLLAGDNSQPKEGHCRGLRLPADCCAGSLRRGHSGHEKVGPEAVRGPAPLWQTVRTAQAPLQRCLPASEPPLTGLTIVTVGIL